jgi:peptidoglycan/xylan/chitin deacetylase (PgdA/CDA1 family)
MIVGDRAMYKLRRGLQFLKNKISPGSLILLYHRIAEADADPWSLCVTPQNFAEQLQVLQQCAIPVSLTHLVDSVQSGKCLRRSVVITFDDGYGDNLRNAKPILEQHGIPATVFVATGYMDQQREFWWDELENLLLQPGTLPPHLRLNIQGTIHTWDLGESAQAYMHQQHRHWKVGKPDPSDRHTLFRELRDLLCPLLEDDRRLLLDQLQDWAGKQTAPRSTHRCMSPTEILELQADGLVEIGSHCVTHPWLPALPADLQRQEIEQSKSHLEAILGHPIASFAYPYGEYTVETASLVQAAGFANACAWYTGNNVVRQNTDCFQLPRLQVQNWNGEEFAKRLFRAF